MVRNMREISTDKAIEIRREILEAFHQFCKKHGLRYSLAYGTLLGAVRHKGMIPWDDDIDLIMPREDYDRLEAMYSTHDCEDRYQFVNHRNHPEIKTKIGYYIDYYTLMEVAGNIKKYHGIHVDIYPLDILPDGEKERIKITKQRKLLHWLIRAKDVHPEVLKGRQRLIRQIVKVAFFPINQDKVLDQLNFLAKSFAEIPEHQRKTVCCLCESGALQTFPYSVTKDYILYDYDGKQYYGFKHYDAPLTAWYGDYMTPPREKDRKRPEHKWVRYLYKE